MAEVEISEQTLIITIKGWHKLWALKSQLRYPLAHVRGAEIDPETTQNPVGLRSPGALIPSVLTAGSYRGQSGWDFWDVRRPSNAIVIHLAGENYQRLILEVDDPHGTVQKIMDALSNSGKPEGKRTRPI